MSTLEFYRDRITAAAFACERAAVTGDQTTAAVASATAFRFADKMCRLCVTHEQELKAGTWNVGFRMCPWCGANWSQA